MTAATVLAMLVPAPVVRASHPPPERPRFSSIDSFVNQRKEQTRTPGLAYAVVGPHGIEHSRYFGHDGDGVPVGSHTPFSWGSVSKPITATLVLTLVQDGLVDLDAPVRTYLPELTPADPLVAERITVRHLLEHTSGIPGGTSATDRFGPSVDPYGEALAALADAELVAPPGTAHHYDSANYVVLGALVEAVTGRPYVDTLRERVLEPLGMRDMVTTPDQASARLPAGHRYVYGVPVPFGAPYDPAGPSYGYLAGSLPDLSRFAAAQLIPAAGPRVLSPELVALMHAGTARISQTHAYGLGWRDDQRNGDLGVRTIWHAGAAPGYQATVVILPDVERAVVVLQNAYGIMQDAALVDTALRVARIVAGGAEPAPPSDSLSYPLLLAGSTLLVGVLLVALVAAVHRMARPRARLPRRRTVLVGAPAGIVAGGALAFMAVVVLPSSVGVSLLRVSLWAPDLCALLIALAVLGPTVPAMGLVALLRQAIRATRDEA